MKPRSSISSASSRTMNRAAVRTNERRDIRSIIRPTVATTTWAPERSCDCWERIGAPPKTATISIGRCSAKVRSAWVTWMQSSRVGVITIAWTSLFSGSRYCSSGSPKAAVLPVPVWAWPITSWPPSSSGIACSWIGVGSSKPSSSSACWMSGERPRSLNAVIGCVLRRVRVEEKTSGRWVEEELAGRAAGNQVFVRPRRLGERVDLPDRNRQLACGDRREEVLDHRPQQVEAGNQVGEPESDHRLRAAQQRGGGDLALLARGDPEDDHPPQRSEDSHLLVEGLAAAHVEDGVDAVAAVGLADRLPEVLGAGVDGGLGAETLDQLALLRAGGEADHLRPRALGELHGERAGTAGGGLDDDRLARLDPGAAVDQRHRGQTLQQAARSLVVVDLGRQPDHLRPRHRHP